MIRSIWVEIDGERNRCSPDAGAPIVVREDSFVCIEVTVEAGGEAPAMYVEDLELQAEPKQVEGGLIAYRSVSGRLFEHAFGASSLRVVVGDEICRVVFECQAKRFTAQRVEAMLRYINARSDEVWRLCLARTAVPVGNLPDGDADPEMVLTSAERLINRLRSAVPELLWHRRSRLVPRQMPYWVAASGAEIDPYEILSNLENLTPANDSSDVVINGVPYSASGIDVSCLAPTYDVPEHRVVIGSAYGVRRILSEMLEKMDSGSFASLSGAGDYVSLSDVIFRVTIGSMRARAEQSLDEVCALIRTFEDRLGMVFHGEVLPRVTPYVRSSPVYLPLFREIQDWYEMGRPSFDGLNYLVKLRSITKLYELFCLYRLIEELERLGWGIALFESRGGEAARLPKRLKLRSAESSYSLWLEYEPVIRPFGASTGHLDLVDTEHKGAGEFSRWTPDFVLRMDGLGDSVYCILDAKCTSAWVAETYAIPELTRKYLAGMAVYDSLAKALYNSRILGVFALYAGASESDRPHVRPERRFDFTNPEALFPLRGGVKVPPEVDSPLGNLIQVITVKLAQRLGRVSGRARVLQSVHH